MESEETIKANHSKFSHFNENQKRSKMSRPIALKMISKEIVISFPVPLSDENELSLSMNNKIKKESKNSSFVKLDSKNLINSLNNTSAGQNTKVNVRMPPIKKLRKKNESSNDFSQIIEDIKTEEVKPKIQNHFNLHNTHIISKSQNKALNFNNFSDLNNLINTYQINVNNYANIGDNLHDFLPQEKRVIEQLKNYLKFRLKRKAKKSEWKKSEIKHYHNNTSIEKKELKERGASKRHLLDDDKKKVFVDAGIKSIVKKKNNQVSISFANKNISTDQSRNNNHTRINPLEVSSNYTIDKLSLPVISEPNYNRNKEGKRQDLKDLSPIIKVKDHGVKDSNDFEEINKPFLLEEENKHEPPFRNDYLKKSNERNKPNHGSKSMGMNKNKKDKSFNLEEEQPIVNYLKNYSKFPIKPTKFKPYVPNFILQGPSLSKYNKSKFENFVNQAKYEILMEDASRYFREFE